MHQRSRYRRLRRGGPTETLGKLFASLLVLYHCSDRVVSHGHLPLLNRPRISSISVATCTASTPLPSKRWRTERKRSALGRSLRSQPSHSPSSGPKKTHEEEGMWQEDYIQPYVLAMERRKRVGVYLIFKVMRRAVLKSRAVVFKSRTNCGEFRPYLTTNGATLELSLRDECHGCFWLFAFPAVEWMELQPPSRKAAGSFAVSARISVTKLTPAALTSSGAECQHLRASL
jgi:hypothetical protein